MLTPKAPGTKNAMISNELCALPRDLLLIILSFLNPRDVVNNVATLSKRMALLSNDEILWKSLCEITGKIQIPTKAAETAIAMPYDNDNQFNSTSTYRQMYWSIPCIPVDFPSIQSALLNSSKSSPLKNTTIVLMPGVHEESVDLTVKSTDLPYIPEEQKLYQRNIAPSQIFTNEQIVHICIRAAFPNRYTALMHSLSKRDGVKKACVNVYTLDDDIDLPNRGLFHLELRNLSLFHDTEGGSIWNENTACLVDGPHTLLTLQSCNVQSDSGRGIVVTRGARLWVRDSSIQDCAATGVYVGDVRSSCLIQRSNIIRCGFGRKYDAHSHSDLSGSESMDMDSGHSGVYVEATLEVIFDDSLVAGNSSTGISVIRCGAAALQNSDVIDNGDAPMAFEEPYDRLLGFDGEYDYLIRGRWYDLGGNSFDSKAMQNVKERFRGIYNVGNPLR